VTWGNPDNGGDSSSVQDQLMNVQQICGTLGAFAAILADGTVVTWGHATYGGDRAIVHEQICTSRRVPGQNKKLLAADLYFFQAHHLLHTSSP
jgi:hypothetical protein